MAEQKQSLGGHSPEAHKMKYIEKPDRDVLLELTNVLVGVATHEGRPAKEALYNYEQEYTGERGKGFDVRDSAGKIIGFLGCKKPDEGGWMIDQICVDPNAAGSTEIIGSLVKSAMEYAREHGSNTLDVRVADSSAFKSILITELGFESQGDKKGEMILLRKHGQLH